MTLKDYDRKKITEKGGIIDEAAEDVNFAKGIKNYHEVSVIKIFCILVHFQYVLDNLL